MYLPNLIITLLKNKIENTLLLEFGPTSSVVMKTKIEDSRILGALVVCALEFPYGC